MTPDVREKAVEAMQRAQWQAERSGKNQYDAMEAALDAALPIIREAVEREGACGCVIESPCEKRWLLFGPHGPEWVDDINRATRFARAVDAHRANSADTGMWTIVPLLAPPADGGGDGE